VLTSQEPRNLNENRTIFQAFEWYLPSLANDGNSPGTSYYAALESILPHLSAIGVSHVWIPPGCKATSAHDAGYGIYDLWDLGEFDAKNDGKPSRTRWGSKLELESLCAKANQLGIGILWDAVLNHKAAADAKETSWGVKVDPKGERRLIPSRKRQY
jgi:alpha-amylase